MGMEKLLLTNSSKGVNRHSALSTALKASVSQLLLSRNSAVSATQHPAKERQPSVKLLLRSPATTLSTAAMAVNSASATALPVVNMVRRLGII